MKTGDIIRKLRKDAGLSQAKLGSEIGVTQQSVYQWENNISSIDVSTLINLADFFDVSVDYILCRVTEPHGTYKPTPEPMTLASRKTKDSDPDVSEERMDEIIIQAYKLIMARRKHDS